MLGPFCDEDDGEAVWEGWACGVGLSTGADYRLRRRRETLSLPALRVASAPSLSGSST